MTIHKTASGYVELLSEWGHGKGSFPNANRPATVITDDGDGHYRQWKFTGSLSDSLATLARLEKPIRDGGHVAFRSGAGYYVEAAPDDFWIEDGDDHKPNLEKYPNAIAW